MKTFTALILLLSTLTMLACSSQPSKTSEEKIADTLQNMQLQPGENRERIRSYRVDSWRYIDHRNLIVKAGFKNRYLVSLHSPCFGLNSAFSIGFTSTAGSVDQFEDILVRSHHGRFERCPISDIVKLEPIPEANIEPTRES